MLIMSVLNSLGKNEKRCNNMLNELMNAWNGVKHIELLTIGFALGLIVGVAIFAEDEKKKMIKHILGMEIPSVIVIYAGNASAHFARAERMIECVIFGGISVVAFLIIIIRTAWIINRN